MESDDTSQVVAAARLSVEANHSRPLTAWTNWDPLPCPVGRRVHDWHDNWAGGDCVLVLTHEDTCGSEEQKCSVQRENGEVYLAKRSTLEDRDFCHQPTTVTATTTYATTLPCSSVGFRRCASLAYDPDNLQVSAGSDEHCARLCAERLLCTAWSYEPSASRCWFTRYHTPMVAPVDEGGSNAGTRCEPTSCGTNAGEVFRGNRQFVGEQVHDTMEADSDEGCAQICQSRPDECTAWTYDVHSYECMITHDPNPEWVDGNLRRNGGNRCVLQNTPWRFPL